MRTFMPVQISAIFTATADYHAFLRLKAHNAPEMTITIIHDSIAGLAGDSLPGDGCSPDLLVQDCESIIILARDEGQLIASAVFEVDTTLVEALGAVLAPCAVQNLIIDQCEASIIENGCTLALERAVKVDLDELATVGSEAKR